MNYLYKYLLILTVNLMPFCIGNSYAQSYDLEKIDNELCRLYNNDQQIRRKFIEAMQKTPEELISMKSKMDSTDASNQIYVADLLDNHGWPDNLSDSANTAIFLVIDHAGKTYSEKYFPVVKEKADQEVISRSDAATLEDRILMRADKPQKYGTQTKIRNNETEDVIYVWPVEDPERIDELRTSVGLMPINAYIQIVEEMYKMKVIWDKNLTIKDFKDTKHLK